MKLRLKLSFVRGGVLTRLKESQPTLTFPLQFVHGYILSDNTPSSVVGGEGSTSLRFFTSGGVGHEKIKPL